jgi:murein DD-endopeptidase MepM/ murein hydrolase activator NlpD
MATLVQSENATFLREERVQRSDTVSSLITRLGITDREASDFIRQNPEAQAVSRQLRPGKLVTAKTGENGELHSLYFPLNGKDAALVIERRSGGFVASEQVLKLESQTVVKSGEIRSSLFGATDAAGIPDAIATQLAEIFGGEIDFHRDLRKGDRFSLVYETLSHRGQAIRSGRILSAEFTNNQKTYHAYWFQSEEGKFGYYTADGKSLRKAFLRSPLEFSRVTSGFTSARFHPVLQTWRAHKGVDYGAPTGTRVRSVADGVVEVAGRQGGYGNLIVLKHQGTYSTAYGHLSGFASGIRKGARVSQGDTIGYVGQTGLASGPHLHYEFRVNSQQVNPLAVTLPTAIPLEAAQLGRYKASITPLRAQLELAKQIQVAAIE